MSNEGAQCLHLACRGGGSSLYRPSVIPLFPTLELVGHGFADVFMTYRMMKSYINKNLTLSNEN